VRDVPMGTFSRLGELAVGCDARRRCLVRLGAEGCAICLAASGGLPDGGRSVPRRSAAPEGHFARPMLAARVRRHFLGIGRVSVLSRLAQCFIRSGRPPLYCLGPA